jgi:DNA-binding IclR family transcriptional regulator
MRHTECGTLSRALAVLDHVVQAGRPVAAAELTRSLDLPKPSAHRICRTLEAVGLLVRHPVVRGMTIGPRLSRLGVNVMLRSADHGERRSILRTVVAQTGETCTLTVLDGDESLCLDRVESSSPLQVQLYAGSRVPLHCTASGKIFLAALPKARANKFLRAAALKRHTPNTIVDPRRLERELERVRRDKLATDNEEFLPSLVAVAVPVLDDRGRTCGAISLNAPVGRMRPDDAARHVGALRRAAASLTAFFA